MSIAEKTAEGGAIDILDEIRRGRVVFGDK
jgi:hypothetical protein